MNERKEMDEDEINDERHEIDFFTNDNPLDCIPSSFDKDDDYDDDDK